MTIIEKIFSVHCRRKVRAGDFAVCDVDFCFGQDGTSALIIERIEKLGLKKLANARKFAMVIDHSAPSPNLGISRVHHRMREFAAKYKLNLYDIGCGVCHEVVPAEGNVFPGDLVLGADSHTCTYGALGAAGIGVGSTDLAIVLAGGNNWFRVPATIKIELKGRLPRGVYAKDAILYIIGRLGANGATYKVLEFCGDVVRRLPMDGRFTLCNMAIEAGAKTGIIAPDNITFDYIKDWVCRRDSSNGKKKRLSVRELRLWGDLKSSPDADYDAVYSWDLSRLTPQVACPHSVDNVVSISKIAGKAVDQAFLGTCTNGRLDDLKVAARILKGKKVYPGIKFIVAPASRRIYLKALELGLVEIFIRAGAVVIAPGCGPCVGTHMGIPADYEVVISTANRNFRGRMGNPRAEIYLASPATVAASAICGKITDPGKYYVRA